MKIVTKYHGEVEIDQVQVYKFDRGIPGFPDENRFTVLSLSEDGVFQILQSLNTPELAFVITNPFAFFPEYDIELEESALEELELSTEKDVVIYCILTVQDPFEKTTANLQAPVVFNTSSQKAKQVILNKGEYKTKHPIFQNQSLTAKR